MDGLGADSQPLEQRGGFASGIEQRDVRVQLDRGRGGQNVDGESILLVLSLVESECGADLVSSRGEGVRKFKPQGDAALLASGHRDLLRAGENSGRIERPPDIAR